MTKSTLILISIVLLSNVSLSQDKEVKNWKTSTLAGLNGTQSSFVNWAAGGQNNISLLGYINAYANYSKKSIKWSNDFSIALGGMKYLGQNAPTRLQKTDDKIQLGSKLGYRLREHYYLSLVAGFNTQLLDGFPDITTPTRNTAFMAPGYVNLSLGVDYKPNDNLSLFVSPVAGKFTFVMVDSLADLGAFGVEPAVYDNTTGAVITRGQSFRPEFGAYLKFTYEKELFKNINFRGKVDLFSNYLEKPQNIDVNADVLFTFKVNNWFSASLNWTVIYDDDIRITDNNGETGPRLQFKSVLGIGLSYELKNFKEEKK